jgi:hypothetical protein
MLQSTVGALVVLRLLKLQLIHHFQLVLLLLSMYGWGIQFFPLNSSAFFSLIPRVWVTVDQPHVYSIRKRHASLLCLNAGVVFLLSFFVCFGAYLSGRRQRVTNPPVPL